MQKLVLIALMVVGLSACNSGIGYDAKRDPFAQFEQSVNLAQQQDKLILIVAGGEWCSWCFALSDFLEFNQDIDQELKSTFVVSKVYYGDDNENTAFFSQLPEATGYPHFWVITPQRTILQSHDTSLLERGDMDYDREKFLDFIQQWHRYRVSQDAPLAEGVTAS